MEITTTGRLLSAESKPYTFDSKNVITHRLRVMVGAFIYVVKTDEVGVKSAQAFLLQDVSLKLSLISPLEKLSLTLVEIKAVK